MKKTISYYNSNAAQFFSDTVHVDMKSLHDRFLAKISQGGMILDAGCGSGRDTRAFLTAGYKVKAFDASSEMVRLATEHTGVSVEERCFSDVSEVSCYDGVWACASLLHLPQSEIPAALYNLWRSLKPGGAFYFSFKVGDGERHHGDRLFTDADEGRVREWVGALPDVKDIECWITKDLRPKRSEHWINTIISRKGHSIE